jgi:hypothetical protein
MIHYYRLLLKRLKHAIIFYVIGTLACQGQGVPITVIAESGTQSRQITVQYHGWGDDNFPFVPTFDVESVGGNQTKLHPDGSPATPYTMYYRAQTFLPTDPPRFYNKITKVENYQSDQYQSATYGYVFRLGFEEELVTNTGNSGLIEFRYPVGQDIVTDLTRERNYTTSGRVGDTFGHFEGTLNTKETLSDEYTDPMLVADTVALLPPFTGVRGRGSLSASAYSVFSPDHSYFSMGKTQYQLRWPTGTPTSTTKTAILITSTYAEGQAVPTVTVQGWSGVGDTGPVTTMQAAPGTAETIGLAHVAFGVDANNDGLIRFAGQDSTDLTTVDSPYTYLVNDQVVVGATMANGQDNVVNGTDDLKHFFPVGLYLKRLLNAVPAGYGIKVKLKHEEAALNFVYTDISLAAGASDLSSLTTGFGPSFNQPAASATTQQITAAGVELSSTFLEKMKSQGRGVLLVEGRSPSPKPLVMVVEGPGGTLLAEIPIHLRSANLTVDVKSRDRGFAGSFEIPQGTQSFQVNMAVGSLDFGSYELKASSPDTYIYENDDAVFSENELDAFTSTNIAATKRVIQQPVFFVRNGARINFCSISDNLGTLEIRVKIDGKELPVFRHELTADEEFARLIAAATGFIRNMDPPAIPDLVSDFEAPIPPAVPSCIRNNISNILRMVPFGLAEEFSDISIQQNLGIFSDDLFQWLVDEVQNLPLAEADPANPDAWTPEMLDRFNDELKKCGYLYGQDDDDVEAMVSAGKSASIDRVASVASQPSLLPVLTLPPEIANRGLVSKALYYLITRVIQDSIAYAEGAVFGFWDGIKSDVEGVHEALAMPVQMLQVLKEPFKAAAELWHTFKAVKELGWGGVINLVKEMIAEFVGNQEERLALVLPPAQAQDAITLGFYFAGYTTGTIGEQVVSAAATAGFGKIGFVANAIRQGRGAVQKALTAVGTVGAKMQKLARSGGVTFGRTCQTADGCRGSRRIWSLFGSFKGCFVAGTLVVMADGSLKAIDEINTGEQVLAVDPSRPGQRLVQTVVGKVYNTSTEIFTVRWKADDDAGADGFVSATAEHPFWVNDLGWVHAQDLREGMELQTPNGTGVAVVGVTSSIASIPTYNLDIDGPDTFFVSSGTGGAVVVHNQPGDPYKYGDPAANRGKSFKYVKKKGGGYKKLRDKKTGQFVFNKNPQHHFFWDAWIKQNYLGYKTRQLGFPIIELSYLDHLKAHDAALAWFDTHYPDPKRGRRPFQGKEWRNLPLDKMEDLNRHMMQAIGMPIDKIHQLNRLGNDALSRFKRRASCK